MANIANRSPWVVSTPNNKGEQKFRLKSQAKAHLDSLNNPRAKMQQLETAFEVQIKLKDSDGNTVTRSGTFDSRKEAEAWALAEETSLKTLREKQGSFDKSFETMTVKDALTRLHQEYYSKKKSSEEVEYRTPQLVKYFGGEHVLLRELTHKSLLNLKKELQKDDYSASSIRNFFSIVSRMFKYARSEWLFPVENYALAVDLDKPRNAKQRNFTGDEKERLFKSIKSRSPWLMPLVELSLEMSFRLGELVKPGAKRQKKALELGLKLGLQWEGIDFDKNSITLFQEKNDWKKAATEELGRTVPMTPRMREILLEFRDKTPADQRKGYVFGTTTTNSTSHAFTECCRLAEPPIENLTFHSIRKIATYSLSKKIPNAIMLSKITGHRDIKTLADRYYKVPIEDLQIMLGEIDTSTLQSKALWILKKELGIEDTVKFLLLIKDIDDINELLGNRATA